VIEEILKPVLPTKWIDKRTKYHINPTGRFVVGGPVGDCGLTGRKIIVDTYGGFARHGGGAFSGKDPSKVGPFGGVCGALRGEEHRPPRVSPRSAKCRCRTRLAWRAHFDHDRDVRHQPFCRAIA